jgi:uncharacterized protein
MFDIIKQPWHWAIAGTFIGLLIPLLLLLDNKKFGISSTYRQICAICVPANIPFFKYNWKNDAWNLFFVAGIFIGAFLASTFIDNPNPIVVAEATKTRLAGYGITDYDMQMPIQIFNWYNILTLKGFVFFILGGFLVGFGTRYAGGCTSGHSIMGMSNLQFPSLVATIAFMIGGFFSANVLLPFLFTLIN